MHRYSLLTPGRGASLSLLALLSLCAAWPAPRASAQDAPPAAPAPAPSLPFVVDGRAAWDDRFLYFAFQVEDDDVQGTSSRPMSEAAKDDGVAVYLHLEPTGDAPAAPTERTQALVVSVANGFLYQSGKNGQFAADPTFAIKFGSTVQGTLNRSDDRDRGYTVTLALPWQKLGLDPKAIKDGTEIPFVAVVRSRGNGLTATADGVKAEADVNSPAKYGRLRFVTGLDGAVKAKASPGVLAAVRVGEKADKAPLLINGVFKPDEWPEISRFALASPAPRKPDTVAAAAPSPDDAGDTVAPVLALDPARPVSGLTKRVMARYLLGFQADLHKIASPTRGVYAPDGSLLLADQPAVGIGPWFSTDRVGWHRSLLSEMPRVGVDTALVQFTAPDAPTGAQDEKALLVLLTAARELRAQNARTPDLAACLETASLGADATGKTDLSTSEGREALWRAVRRWFLLVPTEMRLRVSVPGGADGRTVFAYPVFLSDGANLSGLNSPWEADLRERFAKEFGLATGGATLLFLGGDNFAGSIAASAPLKSEGIGSGAIRIAVVRPGGQSPLVARRGGATYRASWEAAVSADADWLVLNSWNDYQAGTEIAASRQYGQQYLDLTRILNVTTGGLPEKGVQFTDQDAPRRMRPGQVATVTVGLRNAGRTALKAADGAALAYRWRRGGEIVAHGPLRIPLSGGLLPTQTVRLPVGVLASRTQGSSGATDGVPTFEPLAPGEYTLEIGLTEGGGTGLAASDTPPVFYGENGGKGEGNFLRMAVIVAPNLPDRVEFAESVTPPILTSGATVGTRLRMRWTGDKPLNPDEAQLVYQVLSEDGQRVVQSGTAPLLRPLPPGQWVTQPAILRLGEGGVPSPAFPEMRRSAGDLSGSYRLRWLVGRTQSTDSIPGEYQEQIALYPASDDAKVVPADTGGRTFDAGANVPLEVTVTNRGATAWAAGSHRVGYHWFHPDGVEVQWRPPVTVAIPKAVAPGKSVKVTVPVRMPDRDGAYILAFDALTGADGYLSTGLVSHTDDLGLMPVRVTGGRLRFVNLEKVYNADVIASDDAPQDGNLGGTDFALPAEYFPPDSFGIAAYFHTAGDKNGKGGPSYPSGYFSDVSPSAREISFKYGSNRNGAKNAVTCAGQTIALEPGRYVGLHLAVAVTSEKEKPFTLFLRYKDGTEKTVTQTVAPYLRAPGANEAVAIRVMRRRGKNGDEAAVGGIRHVVVSADVARQLASIRLPDDKDVTVFALTLEK